jgi:uncharacterized repeat protein (TIGR02543 family)
MNPFSACGRSLLAAILFVLSFAALTQTVVAGAPTVSVQIIGAGTVSPNYNGQALIVGKQYSMTAQPKSGFTFIGWSGDQTTNKAKLTFTFEGAANFIASFVDRQKPTLSFNTVPNQGTVSNAAFVVTGKAKDNAAVTNVFCSLNGGDWTNAATGNSFSNWWVNVSLTPGTNTVLAYALDSAGNCSKTNKLKLSYSAAPTSLTGMILTVTTPDDATIVDTFGDKTFSEVNGVNEDMAIGNFYSYKKTGAVKGTLTLKYSGPPSVAFSSNNVSAVLVFTDATSGTFTADGVTSTFVLTPADALAPIALPDATISFTDDDGIHRSDLLFPQAPAVVDNGNLFALANPLMVSLAAAYPGQIGDRVRLLFSHQRFINGAWVQVNTPSFVGTVIDFNNPANTANILFDSPGFLSKVDTFVPLTNNSLSIISFYYENFEDNNLVTNGTGTFTFTNMSPVGALLTLSQTGTNQYRVMNFTSDSSTGTYYEETYGNPGNFLAGIGSGTFDIALPANIITSPKTVGMTNGGNASFSVVAGGTPPLTFQWLFNGDNLTDGTNNWLSVVSGSQTTNLTIIGVATNDFGNYQVVVANNYGSVTSLVAQLAQQLPPQITLQPQDTLATNGLNTGFTVTAIGTPPLTYQWQFNNTNLTNGTTGWNSVLSGVLTTNLVIMNVTNNDSGSYRVFVSNNFGTTNSTSAFLQVTNN